MLRKSLFVMTLTALISFGGQLAGIPPARAINTSGDYEAVPPFLTAGVPPLVMLVMGRDHKLYYEAYNDASDLNGDGTLDIKYEPGIDYYGYFDPYKCYKYQSSRFEPFKVTTDKICNRSGSGYDFTQAEWSGNFLNYLTMSRMDTVRRVLYGGKRSYDGTETASSSVVLERVFIPQDAHSWGKRYDPATSGISIASVAPLPEPTTGRRHLFATTTLTSAASAPIFRLVQNTDREIWDWVSKERPVADNSVASTSSVPYNDTPNSHQDFEDLVLTFAIDQNRYGSGTPPLWANCAYFGMEETFGNPWSGSKTDALTTISPNYSTLTVPPGAMNSNAADQTNYLSLLNGKLVVNNSGTYWFAVDGDDSVECILTGVTQIVSGNQIGTGKVVVSGWYGAHTDCGNVGEGGIGSTSAACTEDWAEYGSNPTQFKGAVYLAAGVNYDIEFRHQERSGQDFFWLKWKGADTGDAWTLMRKVSCFGSGVTDVVHTTYDCLYPNSGTITNYNVRVQVCNPGNDSDGNSLLEQNCKLYPNGQYKPTGILQTHGESENMYFGLLTGSYRSNTAGGVLRKNISSFKDELNLSTGQFSSLKGIVHTINTLRITNFDYASYSYSSNCGWIATRPINAGECRNWGNPVGEMMYETLRYYSGAGTPTAAFVNNVVAGNDDGLDLPKPNWINPYSGVSSFYSCAKPFMLVISDVFPSFDSDHLPGVHSNFDIGFTGTLTSSDATPANLDVEDVANSIFTMEGLSSVTPYFIGQVGTAYDGSCAPKSMTGFGDVRGICPEEPTKQGSFYSASVAQFGRVNDISGVTGTQNVNTFVVGLASPLPRFEIPVGNQTITLVPFAKSVGGYGISSTKGQFQPTNTIVDFYVTGITKAAAGALQEVSFRINYEDVEQGADHDMDAIVLYSYAVEADPTTGVSRVKITMNSDYAAGSIVQHIGYTISGTTMDGTYLEVRDRDTTLATPDPDYFMDTPPPAGDANAIPPGAAPFYSGSTEFYHRDATKGLPRPDPKSRPLPLQSVRYFWPGTTTAARILENPLWYAAKYGGFNDFNGTNTPDAQNEWDEDQDDTPDTYFYVVNPLKLEEQLNKSFAAILARVSSGTAASVISNSRSGEGAIYQSIFYGTFENEVKWVGEIHAFLVDAFGQIREDSNGNKQLDATDLVVVFNDQGLIDLWRHEDLQSQLDTSVGSPERPNVSLQGIKFLWNSNAWLNEIDDVNILNQRDYRTPGNQRYIFTFVDANQNMVADSEAEYPPFTMPGGDPSALPSTADLVDNTKVYPYIQPYPPFNPPAYVTAISGATNFQDYLQVQTRRVMHYIRGADQVEYTAAASGYTIPAFRNRKVDYDSDGVKETWRLGDIIHSTPTVISRPSENYDLIYRDLSYSDFFVQYRNRRSVAYCGANDGMFHAFNAGFFDDNEKKFITQPYLSGTTGSPDTSVPAHELGSELWAYVPYNLLPHLFWLTDPNYAHIYYCDLKPKIFDAKIFANDATHPNGWGTVLVGGMRLGGGKIQADMNKADGGSFVVGTDRTMRSAFFVLDITDPENRPRVLGELAFPTAGYSTCYPTVIPMRSGTSTDAAASGEWYLVFGSGPADASGEPTRDPLTYAKSYQPGKVFVVDLVALAHPTTPTLKVLNSSGTLTAPAAPYTSVDALASVDTNTFISDMISVDYDLDYNADAVYFGTVMSEASGGWGGKLRRVVVDDDPTPANWIKDSVLIDLSEAAIGATVGNGQPITAAPSIALDTDGNRWVYFGTGRFYVRTDASDAGEQSYYGIKEPGNPNWTWGTVTRADLLDVSLAEVFEDGSDVSIPSAPAVGNFDDLLTLMDSKSGWFIDFPDAKERNLGQPTLLGDILTFTTYVPSLDPCEFEGFTFLYAVYYKTGTAFLASVIGLSETNVNTEGKAEVLRRTSLGKGLSITPNIHTGREDGSKVFVQTSTGAIEVIQQANPGGTKSGRVGWREMF